MMIRPELTIVILSYNTADLLRNCLKTLNASKKFVYFRIIVADNGSSDGTVGMLKDTFPEIEIIENGKNLGFAKANNIAFRKVKSEFVLMLNPDTEVFPDSISKVIDYIKNDISIAAATCRVELPDGSLDYSCHRGFPTPWNSFCYFSGLSKLFPKIKVFSGYTMTYKDINTIHEIDALTGAFALIRTEAARKVGWLDEDYFWNGEDLDFCYKLKSAGWRIVYIPDVKIIHYKGSASGLKKSSSKGVGKKVKMKAALSSTEVMKIFYKKHLANNYPSYVNFLVNSGIFILEKIRYLKTAL